MLWHDSVTIKHGVKLMLEPGNIFKLFYSIIVGHFGELGANKNRNPANVNGICLWQAGHPDFKLKE
jgi:hypothetical protein